MTHQKIKHKSYFRKTKMSVKLKHITYFFLFTILSLTVQNTVISFFKDGSIAKTQLSSNSAQPTEEEDEIEKDLFSEHTTLLVINRVVTGLIYIEKQSPVLPGVNNIYTPPPKF